MTAKIAWVLYAGGFYILWAVGFRVRYRRWPVAYRVRGADAAARMYVLTDLGLNLSLTAYTVWLLLGAEPRPVSVAAGLGVVGVGFVLRLWAVLTLGPNWRMGQDEQDPDAQFVARGPYRLLKHPLNAALVVVAVGQGLLTGLDVRAALLVVAAAVYYVLQARAEERHWARRGTR